MKTLLSLVLALVLLFPLGGCTRQLVPDYDNNPDTLSSINQDLARSEDWAKIVEDSSFKLGEKTYDNTDDRYYLGFGSYPNIGGSTVSLPMALEFARQHLDMSDEQAKEFCYLQGTSADYDWLIRKEPYRFSGNVPSQGAYMTKTVPLDIFIGTEPSDDELEFARENNVELYKEPVCYDAFVFVTHKDNPVDSLTVEQIQGIYSGRIKNWKAVGGENKPIIAYQREANSGSQTAMENMVMGDIKMMSPKTTELASEMSELVEVVSRYKNDSTSLGYSYKYYLDNLYVNSDIKILKIDDVSPTDETIRNKDYALSTNYYGVIRAEDKEKTGGKFLDWMLSDEGQKCIQQAGYIPRRAQ